jgi:hypothetical protein
MTLELDEVRADIAAFADDDQEVVVERNGEAMFIRNGEEVTLTLLSPDDGSPLVRIGDEEISYRRFVSHHLARLDVLASRILEKRQPVQAYVDGMALLDTSEVGRFEDHGLTLLDARCTTAAPFASRVVFVTADAGHGKTALLREYQMRQARRFLEGEGNFVFWHVDLQGRQLLRLSEALMGDLGELRVPGLWMQGIIRLLRHRMLVLAIDGFDELAAEQGSTDALGALTLMVGQMQDRGTLVAASRRTFFDTDDYIRRSRLIRRGDGADSEFDQLSLENWRPDDAKTYLRRVEIDRRGFPDPDAVYEAIVAELGTSEHPMVTRPFLLTHIARALLLYDLPPADFIRGMSDPQQGVTAVVRAFIDREVTEKWKHPESGEPYLSAEQHLRLLADVSEEMFRAQRDRLEIETIETITTLLLDEWKIDALRRQQIVDMVKMHVLLTPPDDAAYNTRSFDHPEFRDWFLAYSLQDQLCRLASGENVGAAIGDFLSIAQISDATASYACTQLSRTEELVRSIVAGLTRLVAQEWRPTYLQSNVGTLVPFLLDGVTFETPIAIDADLLYSSLIFEHKRLVNCQFVHGTFVNTSFHGAELTQVDFTDCDLGDLVLDDDASAYETVRIKDCRISSVHLIDSDDVTDRREYAPSRIADTLGQLGIEVTTGVIEPEQVDAAPRVIETETRRLMQRVLSMYRRATIVQELTIERRFGGSANKVKQEVIPLLVDHGVLEVKQWRGAGRQKAWSLAMSLEDVLKADGDLKNPLARLWRAADKS